MEFTQMFRMSPVASKELNNSVEKKEVRWNMKNKSNATEMKMPR
jgi:hypothetical protein